MSGFERALLEGKERNELSQIAESLGKKPPARAKKADIIDLIFELAGVTDEAATAAPEPEATPQLDLAPEEPAEAAAPEEAAAEAGDDAADEEPLEAAPPPAAEKGGRDGGRGRGDQRGGERGQERGQGGQG